MKYKIKLSRTAEKDLEKLPQNILKQIDKALIKLSSNPRPQNAKKLKGLDNLYRLRVGDYRIVYIVEDNILIVLLVRVLHRNEVYKKG